MLLKGRPLNKSNLNQFINPPQSIGNTYSYVGIDLNEGKRITKQEQTTVREFYNKVQAFVVEHKNHPYLRSTYGQMNSRTKYDTQSPEFVMKNMKITVKFLECLIHNIPGEEIHAEARALIEEAHSYYVFFKLAYGKK